MNINRQEIRTGLLVVFTLAVLVAITLYLGAPGVFIPQKTFRLYVENIGGLKQGADVTLAGRKVGQVVKMYSPVPEIERPNPKMESMIEVKVNRSALIYKKVRCSFASTGLVGEYYIDFAAGEESSGVAPDGTNFLCERPAGIDQAVPMVLNAIEPALKTATETMTMLQKTADNLTLLTAPGGDVQTTVAEFRKFGENLKVVSSPGGSLRVALDNAAEITGPNGKFQKALANLEKLTSESGSLTLALKNAEKFTADLAANRDIEQALVNARKATGELTGTINELRSKFSTVAANLADASDTVKRQPWRLIWPSTKKYEDDEPKRKPSKKSSRR